MSTARHRSTVSTTQDGFILSASGELDNDTAAATAVVFDRSQPTTSLAAASRRCIDQICGRQFDLVHHAPGR